MKDKILKHIFQNVKKKSSKVKQEKTINQIDILFLELLLILRSNRKQSKFPNLERNLNQ